MGVLTIADLSVEISGQIVVDRVNLTIAAGESVGLIGASGSGKTTIALAVMGLLPTGARATGSISIDGVEVIDAGEREFRRLRGRAVTYIGQDALAALNPLVTVGSQVAIPLRRRRELSGGDLARAAGELLATVELPARTLRAYPAQLSGGQRQRVAIALAMACSPALLIADEPTSALDTTTEARVLTTLSNVRASAVNSTALLLIGHNIAVVSRLCARLVVMRLGRVVEHGATARLLAEPAHPYTRELVAAARTLAMTARPA